MNIQAIIDRMETLAPQNLALDWDNPGLLVGDPQQSVTGVLLCLDVNQAVIEEAIRLNANLIISHHPIIFKAIQQVTTATPQGQWMINMIKHNISLYTSHTNLDIAAGGVNDSLFEALGLVNKQGLVPQGEGQFLGRVGDTRTAYTLQSFATHVAAQLGTDMVRYVGNADSPVNRVALCGGAASDAEFFSTAKAQGADVYITGDIRYHDTQIAQGLGLNLIDGTHYATENLAMKDVAQYLTQHTTGLHIHVSSIDLQPFQGIAHR